MLFIVTGLTVKVVNMFTLVWDVGCCCAYMYVQHTNLKGGGEDSHEEGEASPPPLALYVEKTLVMVTSSV